MNNSVFGKFIENVSGCGAESKSSGDRLRAAEDRRKVVAVFGRPDDLVVHFLEAVRQSGSAERRLARGVGDDRPGHGDLRASRHPYRRSGHGDDPAVQHLPPQLNGDRIFSLDLAAFPLHSRLGGSPV